jgi:vancomycin resistance protein YoaR
VADDQHFWPAWDSDKGELPVTGGSSSGEPTQVTSRYLPDDATQAIPQVRDDGPAGPGLGIFDAPTVSGVDPVGIYPADDEPPREPGRKLRSGVGRAMMVTGAALGVLVLAYGIDLLVSWGDVPRGVTVAGVDVGGMSRTDAEQKLRQELQPRFTQPVQITAGDVRATLNPEESGLGVDWQATLEQAGRQPLSPITRFTSFWTEREVGMVGKSDEPTLRKAVEQLAEDEINHKKREGNIVFKDVEGSAGAVTPVAVEPRQGQQLGPVEPAMETIENTWLHRDGVQLAVEAQPVKATPDGVQATLNELVKPAVAESIEVKGEGVTAELQPKDIGAAFEFKPADDGSLKATVDQETLKKALQPQLKPSEQEGADAEIVFTGGKPSVKPAKAGRKVDWSKTLKPYLDVIKQTDDRTLTAVYSKKNPDVTTAEAKKLGIKEVIGEFTTGGFASDSGVNIRTVAADVNGAIVKPGETFSLNGYTGPRTKAAGYVEAGIIQNGVPGRAVGGGISQFATTLYNASYFAGMKDAGHKEHSYYISRYPIAREATVFQTPSGASGIDIAFTNDAPTGVAIQTSWSPDSITVKIWGTKRYRVESKTSDKSNVKDPGTKTLTTKNCEESPGIQGFTATDTRILYDIDSGKEVRRESRTAHYNPKPKIECKREDD